MRPEDLERLNFFIVASYLVHELNVKPSDQHACSAVAV
jgi:hypothetical protein